MSELKTEGSNGMSWGQQAEEHYRGAGVGMHVGNSQEASVAEQECVGKSKAHISGEIAKASPGQLLSQDTALCHDSLWAGGHLYKS